MRPPSPTNRTKSIKPKPYVCAPIPFGIFAGMIPVIDMLGGFLFMADDTLARSLVRDHKVRICRTKQKIRALQATEPLVADLAEAKRICSQVKTFGLPHRRETDDNPARVWTQDRMGSGEDKRAKFCRKVCKAVVTSCIEFQKAA